jgi:hypothetical protein
MENIDLGTPVKETIQGVRNYVDQLIDYNKLVLTKKMGVLSSYLTLLVALGFLATLALIFLSFSFVWWYSGENSGERYIGFLIVAGFYIFIAAVVFFFRETLIFKPLRKGFGNVMFNDFETSQNHLTFDSSEMLDAKINQAKEELTVKETELDGMLTNLGNQFTFKNISRQMFQNAYNSFITTSNIIKLGFSLMNRLQSKGSKKKHKKKA